MTTEEFMKLRPGDRVYYYRKVYIKDLSTFSAVIKSKVLLNNNSKYDGGVGSMFVDRTSALKHKLVNMSKKISNMSPIHEHDINFLNYKGPTTASLKERFDKILRQKNIEVVIEKYPEIFI